MGFPRSSLYVIVVSTVLSGLYFFRPSPLIKIFPIITLVMFLNSNTDCKVPNTVLKQGVRFALIASAVGDVLLEIEDNNIGKGINPEGDSLYFLGGLVSFLVAHILYIRAFFSDTTKISIFVKLLLVAFYGAMMYTLLPNAKSELLIPLVIYGAVITFMGAIMIARYNRPEIHPQSKLLALLGALSFVLSDSILAVNKFVYPVPNGKNCVMTTYYVAQVLLAVSTNYDLEVTSKKNR